MIGLIPEFEIEPDREEIAVKVVRPAPYPSIPIGFDSWHDYFTEYSEKWVLLNNPEKDEDEDGEEVSAEPVVVEMAHEVLSSDLAASPKAIAKRLEEQDWIVEPQVARLVAPEVKYKSHSKPDAKKPHRKGDVRIASKEIIVVYLIAYKFDAEGSIGMVIDVIWEKRGTGSYSMRGAQTYDPILGEEWRTGTIKPRPQRDWEIVEGIVPPMGFNQWLDVVAPKPPKPEPKKKVVEE